MGKHIELPNYTPTGYYAGSEKWPVKRDAHGNEFVELPRSEHFQAGSEKWPVKRDAHGNEFVELPNYTPAGYYAGSEKWPVKRE